MASPSAADDRKGANLVIRLASTDDADAPTAVVHHRGPNLAWTRLDDFFAAAPIARPFCSSQPFETFIDAALDCICSHAGVWRATGWEIVQHFLAQQPEQMRSENRQACLETAVAARGVFVICRGLTLDGIVFAECRNPVLHPLGTATIGQRALAEDIDRA